MKTKLYIDKGQPLVAVWPETLSDQSVAWNIHFRGGEVINCISEKHADEGFALITKGIQLAAGQEFLIL